jgi:hypothetical protein
MARVALDLRGVEAVEDEDHDDVAEGVEAERGIGAELRGVEHDLGLHPVPGVVRRLRATAPPLHPPQLAAR